MKIIYLFFFFLLPAFFFFFAAILTPLFISESFLPLIMISSESCQKNIFFLIFFCTNHFCFFQQLGYCFYCWLANNSTKICFRVIFSSSLWIFFYINISNFNFFLKIFSFLEFDSQNFFHFFPYSIFKINNSLSFLLLCVENLK